MEERDRVLWELAELTEQLAQVPHHDYVERARLAARQVELREQAAALWGAAGRSRESIAAELRRLETMRSDLIEHGHVNPAAYSGGGPGGGFALPIDAWKLNRQIDAAQNRDELESRIAELREELAAAVSAG